MKRESWIVWARRRGFFNWIPDKTFLELKYRRLLKKKLDLEHPVTFNEKLQWLKLYDRDPLYMTLVDKYEVKKYVADIIGEEYIIKTLGVWDSFDGIDFDKLPNQFVLKGTHDCGSVIICEDKESFDRGKAKKELEASLKRNYFWEAREWPYKDLKPRIIAEEFIIDPTKRSINDFKFLCFHGKPEVLMITTKDESDDAIAVTTRFDYFDMDGQFLDYNESIHDFSSIPELPKHFGKMKQLAEELARGFSFIRVDFYETGDRIYFGEYTLYHSAGFALHLSPEGDKSMGDMLKLDRKKDSTHL